MVFLKKSLVDLLIIENVWQNFTKNVFAFQTLHLYALKKQKNKAPIIQTLSKLTIATKTLFQTNHARFFQKKKTFHKTQNNY